MVIQKYDFDFKFFSSFPRVIIGYMWVSAMDKLCPIRSILCKNTSIFSNLRLSYFDIYCLQNSEWELWMEFEMGHAAPIVSNQWVAELIIFVMFMISINGGKCFYMIFWTRSIPFCIWKIKKTWRLLQKSWWKSRKNPLK